MPLQPDGRFRFDSPEEMPPVSVSLASTAWNKTGAWRSREPVFGDLRPPCAFACPAGEDIADQLRLCAQGRIREAGELLLLANPLPATTGRVCPHPCTSACNREKLDGLVDIPGVERAIGDALIAAGVHPEAAARNDGRVAVVGAGPAGLTAAHTLALAGYKVTLYDRDDRPGGLLHSGIPPYRLPRDVLDAEIERALRPGVEFIGKKALGRDLTLERLAPEFDGVLLCLGRHAPRRLRVPGEETSGVVDGLRLLAAIHRGEEAPEGERVVVVGGGNTAMDCARSLLRRGRSVTIAYRRDRNAMPAFEDEIEEGLEEGVTLEEWAVPVDVQADGGRVRGLHLLRARPGELDASGRPRPEPIPGSDFTIAADLVVVAAGEGFDTTVLDDGLLSRGFVSVDEDLRTAMEGVYACGDCIGGGGTVSDAIGQGRRAAAALAKQLGGAGPEVDLVGARGASDEVAGFERIRPFYFPGALPRARGRMDPAARLRGGEIRFGFDEPGVRAEAARCFSCGTCTGCDNCFHYCPDQAVVRAAPGRYGVNAMRCKGCGVCVEECPRGAVLLRDLGETDGG